ncbi:MAG: hypothetical protein JJU21_08130, partial [Salinarimonas sp.]|nr:hypothetical protein [Salinarimonas sp.]
PQGLARGQDRRGAKEYPARWGPRQRATGPSSSALGRRFEIAANRLGFNKERVRLRTDLFRKPARSAPGQLALF